MQQLASTAQEKKQLEVKEKALKDALLEEFKKSNTEKDGLEGVGSFSIARRSSWVYSDVVSKLEDDIKIKKDEEQRRGVAEEKVTEYILFKEVKVK